MIAKTYTDEKVLKQLRESFMREGSVHLQQFLEQKVYEKLLGQIKSIYFQKVYDPLRCSYGIFLFHQKALIITLHDFLSTFLGIMSDLPEVRVYSFGHRDYTLLQDEVFERHGILVYLELTPHWKEEFGGSTYLIDKHNDSLCVLPRGNSLVIIKTDPTMKRFVKYVNHTATTRRRLFLEWFYPI